MELKGEEGGGGEGDRWDKRRWKRKVDDVEKMS